VQHAILRQQRGAPIQQFIEDLNVGNPGMLGCQKYKLDRPVTQAGAELLQEGGFPANAFVNDDPFDEFHELIVFLHQACQGWIGGYRIRADQSGCIGTSLQPISRCASQQNWRPNFRLGSKSDCYSGTVMSPPTSCRHAVYQANAREVPQPDLCGAANSGGRRSEVLNR